MSHIPTSFCNDSLVPELDVNEVETLNRIRQAHPVLGYQSPFCDNISAKPYVVLKFQVMLGLKINVSKCEVKPMGIVNSIEKTAQVFHFKVDNLPTTYLGLPLGASSKDLVVWYSMVERVKKKLEGWQKSQEHKNSQALFRDAIASSHYALMQCDAGFHVLLRKRTNIDLMAKDLQSLALYIKFFIDNLCKTGELKGINYTFMDEGFTSKNVESFLQDLKFRPTQLKTLLDKFAAVGILQGYLDYVNRKQAKKALISLVPNTNLQLI
ncbi:hypothetical protein CQW23_23986 [Capsicum baccatum]|uniref:Uncharacterized protein n=1 Tax=Capsicum baccatum TaxID=33114 RepID=A0A2G2VTJ4_CAPBA|nr:hypothetical protein CQW23_23986 [Capsicum baccatum]